MERQMSLRSLCRGLTKHSSVEVRKSQNPTERGARGFLEVTESLTDLPLHPIGLKI